jgi:hypothetical protein
MDAGRKANSYKSQADYVAAYKAACTSDRPRRRQVRSQHLLDRRSRRNTPCSHPRKHRTWSTRGSSCCPRCKSRFLPCQAGSTSGSTPGPGVTRPAHLKGK